MCQSSVLNTLSVCSSNLYHKAMRLILLLSPFCRWRNWLNNFPKIRQWITCQSGTGSVWLQSPDSQLLSCCVSWSLKLKMKLRICHPLASCPSANSAWERRAWTQLWVIPIRPHPEWSWPRRRMSLACYPGTLQALPSVYSYCGSLSPPCPNTSFATASDCLM